MIRLAWAAVLIAAAAPADWLESAWNDGVAEHGNPSITLNATQGVLLELPVAVLDAAHAAGVTTEATVKMMLERYAPRCTGILDLDSPQRHLRVQLFLMRPVAIEDADERTQAEVLDALKSAKQKKLPKVSGLFVVDPEGTEVFVDYVPAGKPVCVTGEENY